MHDYRDVLRASRVTAWRWIVADVVYAIHDRQLAEHGGLCGIRDRSAVEPALARPQNVAAYGNPDERGTPDHHVARS